MTFQLRTALLSAAAAGLLMTGSTWAQQSPSGQGSSLQGPQRSAQPGQASPQSPSAQGSQNQQQTPEGYVLIQDSVVYMMANEPQNHFLQAIDDLRQKDKEKASEEISIGASYIEHLTDGSKSNTSSPVLKSVDQLRQDAKQVQSGKISDPKQLAQDFAQANIDLAQHFQSAADQSLQDKHQVRAGYQLDNAASSLRAAMAWSGQSPDQQAVKAIDQARYSASQLLGPNGEAQSTDRSEDRQAKNGQNGQAGQNQANQNGQGPQQASQALAQEIHKVEAQIAQNGKNGGQTNQNTGNASGRE